MIEKACNIPKGHRTVATGRLLSQMERPEKQANNPVMNPNMADKTEGGMKRTTDETLHAADKIKVFLSYSARKKR